MRSRLLAGSAQLFELLPHVFRDAAKPFGALAVHLARDALQLAQYPLLLCRFSRVIRDYARILRRLALGLGPLSLRFPFFIVPHVRGSIP
jgi:hypothetical protein